MACFEVPEGWTVQAFRFTLDPTEDQSWMLARHFGARSHQRDDNAAINLARYEDTPSVVGPVGAAVKRGADRKTGPGPAGGREARKGRSRNAAEQPRDGVQVA
jgi:putative transposase